MASSGTITNEGLIVIMNRAYKSTPDYAAPSHGLIGSGTSTPAVGNTNLDKPLPATNTTTDACDAVTGWSNSGDADAEALNTTSGEYKEGTGCLNLPMTYSTGSGYWQKTISSTDMSGTEYMYLWYYIDSKSTYLTDTTNTVRIQLGTSGLTNCNNYDTDYDDISDGWNLIVKKAADYDSQEGSGATLATVDTVAIVIAVKASITTNNQRMDFWHYADEDDQKQAITSNYPTFNEGAKTVTNRFTIASTAYNGDSDGMYTIEEVGMRNSDSTFKFTSRDTLGISVGKTDKVRVIVTEVDTASTS
jgi:hypothetical protein